MIYIKKSLLHQKYLDANIILKCTQHNDCKLFQITSKSQKKFNKINQLSSKNDPNQY